jgi:histidinol-phosphate/aromatic aminotransferase/cobyric acid decarboxylase-like protein
MVENAEQRAAQILAHLSLTPATLSPDQNFILARVLRLQEVETALREALQEKELLERKLARLQASREGEVTALKVQRSKDL